MGKIVPLPNNASRHMSLGVSALQKHNYSSAVAHLEKAYKQTPVFEVAKPLVQALVGAEQPQAAVSYISEYMEDFLAGDASTQLVFDVLLRLPDYRFAWAVLHHVAASKQAALQAQIETAEATDRAANASALAELGRKLRHLGGLAPHDQEQLIGQLGRLPRQEMIAAAQPSLTDPDAHPAIRVSLLDALTAVGDDQETQVLGYQTSGTVVPSQLSGVMNDKALLAVLNAVQLKIGLSDPELMRATVETLRFELGYLYPFIGTAITDPAHFAQSYLAQQSEDVTAAERALFTWLAAQTAKLAAMA